MLVVGDFMELPCEEYARHVLEDRTDINAEQLKGDMIKRLASTRRGSEEPTIALAETLILMRRRREEALGRELFADPAWDILLDLYVARSRNRPISISSLCIAASVPATTALRWINSLAERGWLIREADPNDGRRMYVRLTDEASSKMRDFLNSCLTAE
ncbi:winged helix DNA-binding protein [Rhizorhapis suberifaciens]|nr:winged helix DNA-binding protein [Rhizorhapis suberifaciens]